MLHHFSTLAQVSCDYDIVKILAVLGTKIDAAEGCESKNRWNWPKEKEKKGKTILIWAYFEHFDDGSGPIWHSTL
jgi:hypothetical protein